MKSIDVTFGTVSALQMFRFFFLCGTEVIDIDKEHVEQYNKTPTTNYGS
jgi:hypothetical protein